MTASKSPGMPGMTRPAAGIKSHGAANQLTFLESSIFSVAYAVSNAEEFIAPISWLLAILDDIQLISFALITQLYPDKLPWIGAIFAPVRWLADYRAFSAVSVLALSIVFATFVLAFGIGLAMKHQTKVPTPALRLLRLLLTFLTTIFSMPILFLFVGGLNCVNGDLQSFHVQCTAPPHLALLVFDVIGLVIYIPMLLICSLVLIDTNPKSENPLARAHGQVDFVASCIRVLLVVLGVLLPSQDVASLWIYNALTVGLLGFLGSRYIMRQPYFTLATNMARAGFAVGGSVAMLVGSISSAAGLRQLGWTVALGGSGLGFLIGAGAAKWFSARVLTITVGYWHEVVRREMEEQNLISPPTPIGKATAASVQKLVENQTKERKLEAGKRESNAALSENRKKSKSSIAKTKDKSPPVIEIDEHEEDGKGSSDSITAPEVKKSRIVSTDDDSNANDDDDSERGNIIPKTSHGRRPSSIQQPSVFGSIQLRPEDADKMLTGMLMGSAGEVLNAVRERQPKRRIRVFDSPFQVEVCLRIIRDNPTEKQVTLGLQLLERGLAEFPQEPLLLLLASAYLMSFYGADGSKAADVLTRELHELSHRSISMGVKYLVFCRDRLARDRGERILDRAALEALDIQVRRDHLRALCCIRDTWELVRTAESLNTIGTAVEALAKCSAAAQKSYAQLIARSPRDKNVLRAWAQYLGVVEGDAARAHQALELAEDIEAQEIKARGSNPYGGNGSSVPLPAVSADEVSTRAAPALALVDAPTVAIRGSYDDPQLNAGGKDNNYAPSNNSGGNASRAKSQLRRTLADRIRRPLQTHWLIFLGWTIFLATLSCGFFFCLVFFDRTGEIIQRFTISRYARGAALESIEALRLMVYHSNLDRQAGYQDALEIIKKKSLPELNRYLPQVSQWEALEGSTSSDYHRLSLPKFTPNSTNYVAVDLKANELVNLILQASQLATSFTQTGSFNHTYFSTNMELLWITENLWPAVKGIKGLGLTKVDQYNSLMSSNQSLLLLSMGGMYLSMIAVGVLASLLVINPYFSNEDMILRMLQRVPKRAIASLVSQAEEDVETYCEVVGLEDPESDLGVDIKRTASTSAAATTTWHRNTKYKTGLAVIMGVMGVITYCMYGVALGSNSLQGDIIRLSHTSNRRYACSAWRVLSREYFQPDPALSVALNIMNGRTLVKNLKKHHDDVKKDPASIDAIFPAATIFPRDCSSPGSCNNITDIPEIGFTRAVASQPLNAQLDRLIEVAGSVVDFMTLTTTNPLDMNSEAFTQWRLSLALSHDVVARLTILHNLMYRRMMSTVEAGTAMCIILFVFSLASFVAALFLFYIVGIGPLARQAQTITSLLYLIPPSVLKESPELQKFVESGAIVLDVRQ